MQVDQCYSRFRCDTQAPAGSHLSFLSHLYLYRKWPKLITIDMKLWRKGKPGIQKCIWMQDFNKISAVALNIYKFFIAPSGQIASVGLWTNSVMFWANYIVLSTFVCLVNDVVLCSAEPRIQLFGTEKKEHTK